MIWVSSRWKIALMLAPALVLFTAFFVYPVGYAIAYSFTNSAGFGAAEFIGIDNYVALMDDPFFWQSLRNTLVILVVSLVVLIPVVVRPRAPAAPQHRRRGRAACAGVRAGDHRSDPGRPDLGLHPRPEESAC